MYKNNSRFSCKHAGCSPLQLLGNLTRKKPAIGYYSYTNRYHTFEKKIVLKGKSLRQEKKTKSSDKQTDFLKNEFFKILREFCTTDKKFGD